MKFKGRKQVQTVGNVLRVMLLPRGGGAETEILDTDFPVFPRLQLLIGQCVLGAELSRWLGERAAKYKGVDLIVSEALLEDFKGFWERFGPSSVCFQYQKGHHLFKWLEFARLTSFRLHHQVGINHVSELLSVMKRCGIRSFLSGPAASLHLTDGTITQFIELDLTRVSLIVPTVTTTMVDWFCEFIRGSTKLDGFGLKVTDSIMSDKTVLKFTQAFSEARYISRADLHSKRFTLGPSVQSKIKKHFYKSNALGTLKIGKILELDESKFDTWRIGLTTLMMCALDDPKSTLYQLPRIMIRLVCEMLPELHCTNLSWRQRLRKNTWLDNKHRQLRPTAGAHYPQSLGSTEQPA